MLVFILTVTLVMRVSRGSQHPGGAMAWLLAIILMPYLGVPLYLTLGGRKLARRTEQKEALYTGPPAEGRETTRDVERILSTAGLPPRQRGNKVALHFSGESAYLELMRLIEDARHTIHIATFILGRGPVGHAVVDALTRKAREGVTVRLLLDSLGCFYTRRRTLRPLQAAGGKVGWFLPMLPLRRKWSANLRNHRKIVVVDGREAMLGGMNLDQRFMGPEPHPERYVDAAVFVEGPAVADIDNVFVNDWTFTTEETVPPAEHVPAVESEQGADLQVAPSGPDVPEDTLYDALLTAAINARERIWVVTPYFVPDEAMVKLLALQARVGRDVRVVLPAISNHRVADLARGVAVRELARAGARIYAFPRRMLHAKTLLFDDSIAIIGSPNLDMRSLYLNFEIALLHYSEVEVQSIRTWIEELIEESQLMDLKRAGFAREWAEGLAALASPML